MGDGAMSYYYLEPNMNALDREPSMQKPPPDLIRNLTDNDSIEKCTDKRLLDDSDEYAGEYDKECDKEEPHWSTQAPGELVEGREEGPCNRRKKRRRKVKRALGWTFWIVCLPLALLTHYIRDVPEDDDDRRDDPLRPWHYSVSPEAKVTYRKDS